MISKFSLMICISFLYTINVVLSFYGHDDGEMYIFVALNDGRRICIKEVEWDKRYLFYSNICVVMNLQRGLVMKKDPIKARIYIMVYCGKAANRKLKMAAKIMVEQMNSEMKYMNIKREMMGFFDGTTTISTTKYIYELEVRILFKKLGIANLSNMEEMSEDMVNNIIEERQQNSIISILLNCEKPKFSNSTAYEAINKTFTLFGLRFFQNNVLMLYDQDEKFPKIFVWIGNGAVTASLVQNSSVALALIDYKYDNNLDNNILVFYEKQGNESALFKAFINNWDYLVKWRL